MVIQNQEGAIALLYEINEVKGNFIDNETANQKLFGMKYLFAKMKLN